MDVSAMLRCLNICVAKGNRDTKIEKAVLFQFSICAKQ